MRYEMGLTRNPCAGCLAPAHECRWCSGYDKREAWLRATDRRDTRPGAAAAMVVAGARERAHRRAS